MSLPTRFGIKPLVLLAPLLLAAPAAAAWLAQGPRAVTFTAIGPGGLRIEGKGNEVDVREQNDTVSVSVGLGSLTTGIALRDRHMKEKYLETAKYPRAVFTIDKSLLKAPFDGNVDGKLSLHGVTRPLTVHYTAQGASNKVHVTGSAQLNMKDYRIDVPSYLGVTVKPNVTVAIQFDAANN